MFETKGETKTYRDLDVIFREGDSGTEMYVIKSGKVQITKKMQGIVVKIAVLEPGDFFGEMALLENQPRAATTTALGKVEVSAYDKDALAEGIKGDQTLAFKLLEAMGQRVRRIDEEVTRLIAKGLLPKEEAQKIRRYTFAGTFD